jgi:PAS domain S-box-containing protein
VDVTERRRAERALAASEELYRRIVETAHEGVITLDAGGKVTFASQRMADMLGCTPEDLVGQSLEDLIDGDEDTEPLSRGQAALVTGTDGLDCLLRRKNGGRARAVVSTAPRHDAAGAFTGATVFVADITEHRQSEERFRRAFEAGSVIMFVTSNEHDRIVDANEALLKHLGLPRERVVGRDPLELGLVPDPGSKQRAERILSAEGRLRNMTVQYRDRSGDPRTLLISVDRIHVGDEPCWLTSAVDITEREEAVKALRESEELYAKAFAASPDAVSLMAIPSGEILAVNEGFVSLFDYTKQELLGRTDEQLGLWWSPEGRNAAHERLSQDGRLHNLEVLCRSKDGRQLPCSLSAEKVVLGGRTCLLSYLHDLTDQRSAESERLRLVEQLQQAAKMEAVGQLAGGVAHDFNNLLTPILGYSEMLTEMLQPGTSEQHHAAEIAAMGERAAALTRQLLAFSRKQVLRPTVVDLDHILKGLAKMLRRLIDEDVEIEWLLADNLGSVLADPGQLEQVIVNLAVNARDAMPGGGVLSIRTCGRHLGPDQAEALGLKAGNCVQLEVSDTGTGMDAETRSRIFEPFFTTKAMGRGTGLGLSTVYGIVGQSGGAIEVESRVGQGTTFRILLPEVASPVEQSVTPPRESAGGYETLLVAEDDETVRALLERVLVAAGYTVLTAATGDEALRLAKDHSEPIHLLLSDVVMPGLHGQGLASELAAIRPETRVLLMSGYSSAPSRDSLGSPKESPFLEKPFKPHEVCRKVREVLDAEPGRKGEGPDLRE